MGQMGHHLRGFSAGSSKIGAASVDELTALLKESDALKRTMRELCCHWIGDLCFVVAVIGEYSFRWRGCVCGILVHVIQTRDRAVRTPTQRWTSCKSAPKIIDDIAAVNWKEATCGTNVENLGQRNRSGRSDAFAAQCLILWVAPRDPQKLTTTLAKPKQTCRHISD